MHPRRHGDNKAWLVAIMGIHEVLVSEVCDYELRLAPTAWAPLPPHGSLASPAQGRPHDPHRRRLRWSSSDAIEADLRTWVRRHGIVLWLDADGHYSDLVDRLAAARSAETIPYDVFAFRGSYLELSMQLQPLIGGAVPKPLVVHLPGFNEQSVRQSPLLELHLAGARYRKALDTAVTDAAAGRVHPDAIEAFRSEGATSLGAADAWLHGQIAGAGTDVAGQLRAMSLVFVLDDLLGGGPVGTNITQGGQYEAAWAS